MDNQEITNKSQDDIIEDELNLVASGTRRRKFGRFIMGALGSIPWVGGIISASAAAQAEKEQSKTNELHKLWLEEHRERFTELGKDIAEILQRLEELYDNSKDRIESDDYLVLVRKAFKSWDQAETKEKRQYIKNLIINAAATELCVDDIVRLFNDWIDTYHEAHFKVIRLIYENPGITRGRIWDSLHSERPQENSAEADLYKMLIRDLNMGGVIRQERQVNIRGEFVKKTPARKTGSSSKYESAFENTKPYTLTELGKQFVHYTMSESVKRINGA